jgi:hypothetical protein
MPCKKVRLLLSNMFVLGLAEAAATSSRPVKQTIIAISCQVQFSQNLIKRKLTWPDDWSILCLFSSDLESSGSLSSALNPRGVFRSLSELIVDFAELHVAHSLALAKETDMADDETEKEEAEMKRLKQTLMQVRPIIWWQNTQSNFSTIPLFFNLLWFRGNGSNGQPRP